MSFDIPGMGYRNLSSGAIEGFEPDLARALAARLLGSPDRVDFVQVIDDQRIQALQEDVVDFVVSQLTITPDRAELVNFTIPYWITQEAILVRRGSGIHGFDDLRGKRIAATAGSVSIRRMRASLAALPGATIVETPLSADNREAVVRGDADAASNDLINLTCLNTAAPDADAYEIIDIGEHFEPKPFGIAVKKGRQELLSRLNRAIEELQAAGEIQRLLEAAMAGAGQAPCLG
ncbi:MAG: transporter substrate-binding domain-containing protein [Synechococcus sp.]|nr:transporter substrate-binding domain-containing protein [Synechococcus sp.]